VTGRERAHSQIYQVSNDAFQTDQAFQVEALITRLTRVANEGGGDPSIKETGKYETSLTGNGRVRCRLL
jgi:hypothetical protein